MATSFPQFDRLPPEIRRLIWDFTLPHDGPALCLYRWRWYAQFVDPYGEINEFEGVDRRAFIEVPMPIALFVCREAREAANAWIAARHLTMRFREETQGDILVREWDRERDPVYVPRNKWEDFCNFDEYWDDGAREMGAAIKHLAVPAFTGYFSIGTLAGLLDWMPNLRTLYIVWAELPAIRKSLAVRPPGGMAGELHDAEVQPRWEMVNEVNEVTSMCVVDPDDGEVSWEEVDLADFIDEIEQHWAISEVPEQFVADNGEVNLKMVHVRIKEVGVALSKATVDEP
ncbi:hypothetical protein G7Z17_g9434 [Cylindrodendrum hubeiense]|uniref:2EXR domain-containing protein n=1 Tax=Cylindrodendrum hubeiense TaxID=595255 RepID=A0A9P5H3Y5_9HYPO|nr:hypothetical protein G7Z17_g9434 [Cylindrodendrum hubeiense]